VLICSLQLELQETQRQVHVEFSSRLFGHLSSSSPSQVFKFFKMKLQDLSQNTGGQKVIILSNLLLRFGQLVTGVVTIILYSQENGYWLNKGIPVKIVSSTPYILNAKHRLIVFCDT
jgi:hypothetical protein